MNHFTDGTTCRDCDLRIRWTLAEIPPDGGEWVAEDDTAGCAGRGEPGEVLPHRPICWTDGPTSELVGRYSS